MKIHISFLLLLSMFSFGIASKKQEREKSPSPSPEIQFFIHDEYAGGQIVKRIPIVSTNQRSRRATWLGTLQANREIRSRSADSYFDRKRKQ